MLVAKRITGVRSVLQTVLPDRALTVILANVRKQRVTLDLMIQSN
jgi:hypothetical protein